MSRTVPESPVSKVTAVLAQGRLGVWPVVCLVLAAAAPLTVVFGGATTGFAVTGITGIPVSYLAIGVILAVFAAGYVAMSRKIVNAGAFYTYVSHGLGRPSGVGASFVAVLAYNAMQIGLYGGLGPVLGLFLHSRFDVSAPWYVWAFAGWAIVAVLGVLRIDINGRVLAVLLVAEIITAVIFSVVAVAHPAGAHVSFDTLSPRHLVGAGIGAALAIAITGFVGFENTAVFSEESKNPRRTIAIATFIAVAIIAVLYGFGAWSMTVGTGPDHIVQRSTQEGTELFFNLAAPYVGQLLVDLGHVLFVTSLFAALLSFHNTAARYHFALGREGVLPRFLGRTSARTRAPWTGSLVQTILAAIVLGVYAAQGWDPITRLFFWITVLGGLGVLILMAGTSIAVIGYFAHRANRDGVSWWSALIAPVLAAIALTGVLGVTLRQFATLLGVAPTDPLRWQFPGLYLVAAVIGVVWALFLRVKKPQVWAGIGRGANSVLTEPARRETAAAGVGR
jgi:amino acid transporter